MKKFFANIVVLFVIYVIGSAARITFVLLKWAGKIRIVNPENFPKLKPGMLVVSNHPDLLDCQYENFLIPAILFPQIILHPFKLKPWFTPDKHNFTDKWYWAWLRPMAISVQRGEGVQGAGGAIKMLNILSSHKGIMIYSPEGGRTCTGNKFQFSNSGKNKIRILKSSVGWLVLKTKASIIPIWLENGEVPHQPGKKLFSRPNFKRGQIIIKFGKPMELDEETMLKGPFEITNIIAKNLLELADQE